MNNIYSKNPYWILKRYTLINGFNNYKINHAIKNIRCRNCNSILFKEINKDINYPYVCLICDENMYNFETIKY
jgi:hypothetical protein